MIPFELTAQLPPPSLIGADGAEEPQALKASASPVVDTVKTLLLKKLINPPGKLMTRD
jgi:hypothetical protein